jgi:hypothetical protein
MFSRSLISRCRFSGFTLAVLFLAGFLCAGARAQSAPAAIASFATGVNHTAASGNIGTLGTIANVATDSYGDLLAVDASNGALYEFPAGGADAVVLVASGGLAGTAVNQIATPGIAIDAANNLYIEGGSCILTYPYPWSGLSALTPSATSAAACGGAATFYNFGAGTEPWGIAMGSGSASLVAGSSPAGASAGGSIVSIPVTGASNAPVAGTPTTIVSGMAGAAISIAVDPSGNTYFVENGTGALVGAYEIPAGQNGLTSDAGLARIDPSLPQVTGVGADSGGNVYIGDNTEGVFILPQGAKSSSAAFQLTTVTAQGGVAFSGNTGLFVPTTQTQSNGYGDVAEVAFNAAPLGAVAVGATTPASASVTFTFNAATTPGTIEVLEAGKSMPDFAVVSASKTCLSIQTPPPYGGSGNLPSCPVTVSFAPQSAGNISATLIMLDKNNNLLGSIPLSGSGTSAAVQVTPAAQSTIGNSGTLVSPSQIAIDAAGNLYVADPGLKKVELYPSGSTSGTAPTSVGTGLVAPTGVAVDGAGDVFIADSGSVYEIPETANGLNAKGQVTLQTGLGSKIQLAADGLGNLYISDSSNQKVYELENFSTGWNASLPGVLAPQAITLSGAAVSAPSAIAVDHSNDLFVVDGSSVYEITPAGAQAQVLSGVSGINGLSVDPSGSLYASIPGGTVRIPYTGGALDPAKETTVASGVTSPAAVALDSLGNIYVADAGKLDVNLTGASAFFNFGTLTADPTGNPPSAGSSSAEIVTLLNYGNAPLKVTGYNSPISYFEPIPDSGSPTDGVAYTEADFTETSDTCTGNSIAVDSTCTATVTFSPAPGDGGNLTGQVLVEGNVANAPVGVNGIGVAPTLAGTTTAMTASSKGTIEGVPVSVTVTPNAAGSPTPTGTVTLTVQYGANVPITNPAMPTKYQLTAQLSNGTATFDPTQLPIANYTFNARYNGDTAYTYANSINSGAVAVATPVPTVLTQPVINASALNTPPSSPAQLEPYTLPCTSGTPSSCTTEYSLGQPSGNPAGYLVPGGLCTGCSGTWGFDGSDDQWLYDYDVTVASASGDQMIGTAVYSNSNCTSGLSCETGWNYGAVNNLLSTGSSICGNLAGSSSIINAADVTNNSDIELAQFPVSCAPVTNTNTTVPVFTAFYTFTPAYSGTYNDLTSINPNYESSKGTTPINIWAVSHPVVQINSSPATITVNQGSSASATLTISSVLGYGFVDRGGTGAGDPNYAMPIALQCQGLPAYASCSFSYPAPNPADAQATAYPAGSLLNSSQAFPAFGGLLCQNSTTTYCAADVGPPLGSVNSHSSSTTPCDATDDGCLGPAQVVMTITTNVPVNATASIKTYKGGMAIAGLFGLGLLGLGFRRRVSRLGSFLTLICVLFLGGALTAGITACNTKTLGSTSTGVTPKGSYWVTVTANQVGTSVVSTSTGPYLVSANGNQMSLPYTIYVTVGQ